VAEVAGELDDVQIVVAEDVVTKPHHRFDDLVAHSSPHHEAPRTTPDTPGLLIYTSGTTGAPKGALHGHRVLLGHLPGYELMFNFFPQADDRVWTPADWAWIGGLMDALMPAWFHGKTVIGAPRASFDPEWAVDLMVSHRVRAAFLPATALKLMRHSDVPRDGLSLRAVMSGGEALGESDAGLGTRTARRDHQRDLRPDRGQPRRRQLRGVLGGASRVDGPALPGHDVAVLGPDDEVLPPGEVGELAVRAPDPVMFLEYWNRPEATAEKVRGGWLRTGDLGHADEDGYLYFSSRNDDVINSAGYRIGPTEIEECLLAHPAVATAAAVGVPDEIRGQVVKAFIVLADGQTPSAALEEEISHHVRSRLRPTSTRGRSSSSTSCRSRPPGRSGVPSCASVRRGAEQLDPRRPRQATVPGATAPQEGDA
jgi:acetyl-CoA synthetase